jgi:hypothetical protein
MLGAGPRRLGARCSHLCGERHILEDLFRYEAPVICEIKYVGLARLRYAVLDAFV